MKVEFSYKIVRDCESAVKVFVGIIVFGNIDFEKKGVCIWEGGIAAVKVIGGGI